MLTYIAILVIYFFKITIVIIAFFNLEIKQFNVINAFENAKRLVKSLLVAYQLFNKFKISNIYAKIN